MQLLLNYWQEIHQTFTDNLPWCVVVHEGGDWHSHFSTKSYGPLLFLCPRYSKNCEGHYVLHLSVRPYVRPYDLSTQLLLYYWQEIHQTFPDYSPRCVVVHEGGDSHYHISTKSYGPLLIFLICSI